MQVGIHPYLCLEFVHEQTGVDFTERYFNDPEYRFTQDVIINRRLHAYFCRNWPEFASWYANEPLYTVGAGAAFVIVSALFGSQIRYFDNFHPDCSPDPLAWVTDPEQIQVPDVANTWPLNQYLDQYADMVARHGKDRVCMHGFNSGAVIFTEYLGLSMHSPLTQAYKLRGSQLFLDMVEKPELARRLFDVVCETYYRIWDLLLPILGLHTDVIFYGACASSWTSERVWREWEMPAIKAVAERYGSRLAVHSCGRSTHVLKALSEIPGMLELHLGDKTDLALARKLLPEVGIYIVPDSVAWARDPAEKTCASVRAMMEAAASGPMCFQFVMEAGLRPETISAIVGTVREFNERRGL